LSVLVGINDVARRYAEPEKLPRAVYEDEYELTYRQLLSQAKQRLNCQLVLMEPFMFCSDAENELFEGLRGYIDIVDRLAGEFGAILVPLQSEIDKQIRQVPSGNWSLDTIHPYVWAHAWIARCWLQATGL